jgi:hypothetical protein
MSGNRNLRRSWIVLTLLATLLMAYVGSYLILSRRGIAETEAVGGEGFYFFPPENTDHWRAWNYGLAALYYPLSVIDEWLGTGKGVASEPMWKLSLRSKLFVATS